MNLQRMRYFVALGHELHFGRAAERLHLAQPGLSQQIKVLERELGVQLLVRGPGGVKLTEPGRVFLEEAEAILRRIDEVIQKTQAAAKGFTGRLRVIYTRSAPDLGHDLVTAFRSEFPAIEISTETAWTERNLELVRAGEVDVAFVRLPLIDADGIELMRLSADELMLAVPTAHALAGKRLIHNEELYDEPIVLWPRVQAPGAYDAVRAHIWGEHQPKVVLEEPDSEHILTAVEAGAGVALLSERSAHRLRREGVVFRRLAAAPLAEYGLAWRPAPESAARERFLEVAERRFALPEEPEEPDEPDALGESADADAR